MSVIRDQIAFAGVSKCLLKKTRKKNMKPFVTFHRPMARFSGFVLSYKSINCLNVVS